MTLKKVTKFETSDGKLFDDPNDAKTHEAGLELGKQLRAILAESIRTGRPDAVVGQLVMEATAVTQALISYRKRLPRLKTVEEVEPLRKAA